jgi:DNA-binding GntR family transcriptional regulator
VIEVGPLAGPFFLGARQVSTGTVERSLSILKDEWLIVARIGRGFFVSR